MCKQKYKYVKYDTFADNMSFRYFLRSGSIFGRLGFFKSFFLRTFGVLDVRGSGFLDVRSSDVRDPFSDVWGSFEANNMRIKLNLF